MVIKKIKEKMQIIPPKFNHNSFRIFNFTFVQLNPLIFKLIELKSLLMNFH